MWFSGEYFCVVLHAGIDLIAAFYGCLYAGCVPITVRPPHPQNIATTLPTVKMIVEVSRQNLSKCTSRWNGQWTHMVFRNSNLNEWCCRLKCCILCKDSWRQCVAVITHWQHAAFWLLLSHFTAVVLHHPGNVSEVLSHI